MQPHTIPFSDIRSNLTRVTNQVEHQKKHYVLTKNNHPAVAIIPIEDFEDQEDVKLFEARRRQEGRPIDEFWKELGLDE